MRQRLYFAHVYNYCNLSRIRKKITYFSIILLGSLASAVGNLSFAQQNISPIAGTAYNKPSASYPTSIYDYKVTGLNGETIDFAQFKGKKILIVNTTSVAGNNPQFAHLESMHKKYKDKLVIIGFPDDDFGEHPASGDVVEYYKKVHYNVSFIMAAKVGVKGANRAPIYVWLTEKKYNHFKDSEIKWDFQKYLINENGDLVAEFDPKIRATSDNVISAIEQ